MALSFVEEQDLVLQQEQPASLVPVEPEKQVQSEHNIYYLE